MLYWGAGLWNNLWDREDWSSSPRGILGVVVLLEGEIRGDRVSTSNCCVVAGNLEFGSVSVGWEGR